MLDRVLLALGFFILGLNAIYFGCIENGSNNRRNPTWELLSGFVEIEKLILEGTGIVIGVLILCQAGVWALNRIERHRELNRIKLSVSPKSFEPVEEIIAKPIAPISYRETIREEPKIKIEIAKRKPIPILRDEKVITPIQQPTATELKERALADLLRS